MIIYLVRTVKYENAAKFFGKNPELMSSYYLCSYYPNQFGWGVWKYCDEIKKVYAMELIMEEIKREPILNFNFY